MARERNATVRAAVLDARAARERTTQARSQFFPTVTPIYQYQSSRRVIDGSDRAFQEEGGTTSLTTSWRVLDTGQRQFNLLSASRSEEATRLTARQTLRTTLFTVHDRYFEALRTEQLLSVAEAQVENTRLILDQVETRVRVGDAARKDTLQARADFLNARVQAIQARNRYATAQADLKAVLGYDEAGPLPRLVALAEPSRELNIGTLTSTIQEGLSLRPDLRSARQRVEAQQFTARRLGRESGLTFAVDASLDLLFSPDRRDDRTVTFRLSYPLFDAGQARAAAREAILTLEATRADLVQLERNARAEIESAYAEVSQNVERVEAARAAREAAQENYRAALEAQRLGASNLLEVSTARVSLVTAESNYIEAIYDYYSSDARLRLVAGRPLAGESEPTQ